MLRSRFFAIFSVAVIMVTALCIGVKPVQAKDYWPTAGNVSSKCATVIDAETGTVLYEKNTTKEKYPASITKIMTAMLAIEKGNLDDTITFSEKAVYDTEGSSILRDVGEQLSLRDCLYALMLESANDCAYAIAEYIAGDIDSFAKMMNEKAKELGCKNTHFVNPHGLPDDDHYTCARDMALIAKEAYKNETFRTICGTKEYILPKTNKHDKLVMHNHHQMLYPLKTTQYLYDNCVGGKTGYTTVANNTLVTYATKDDMTLICVVMDCITPAHYIDTKELLDFCFDNYQMVKVSDLTASKKSASTGDITTADDYLSIDKDAEVIIPKTAKISEITSKTDTDNTSGDSVGTINYYYGEHEVGSADIVTNKVKVDTYEFDNESDTATEVKKGDVKKIVIPIIIIAAIVVVIIIISRFIMRYKKKTELIIKDNYRKKNKRRRKKGPNYL